jgi:hypothetical protein
LIGLVANVNSSTSFAGASPWSLAHESGLDDQWKNADPSARQQRRREAIAAVENSSAATKRPNRLSIATLRPPALVATSQNSTAFS